MGKFTKAAAIKAAYSLTGARLLTLSSGWFYQVRESQSQNQGRKDGKSWDEKNAQILSATGLRAHGRAAGEASPEASSAGVPAGDAAGLRAQGLAPPSDGEGVASAAGLAAG